jgi:hypothetical protein
VGRVPYLAIDHYVMTFGSWQLALLRSDSEDAGVAGAALYLLESDRLLLFVGPST